MDFIKNLFGKTNTYSATQVKKVDTRRLAARMASGNVALQLGKFMTREQVDAKRKELSSYTFKLA